MQRLDSADLKNIMFTYEIPNVELAHYIGYSRQHISLLRSGKFTISYKFQALLVDFLVRYRGVDFNMAASLTKLK